MNTSYPPPPPGQAYPPGSLPPVRRGMGCFAKGCLVTVTVFVILGIIAGIGGWYIYSNVRPFVSTEPVAIRKFPATAEQYEELQSRIAAFQTRLKNEHSASLELSADDLNIFVTRSPNYERARGKIYLGIVDNQLVIDGSFPVSDDKSGKGSAGTTYYFNGRLYCDFSFSDGDFTIIPRKIEPLDGQPPSAFIAALVSNPGFSRSLNRAFNEGFHSALRKNPAGEAFVAQVRSIIIQNNRLVIAAEDR